VRARILGVLLLAFGVARAGEPPAADSPSGYASANLYLLEDGADYVQPTVFVDRGRLHLEARYNYEDVGAGSAWAGINLSAGNDVTLAFTPMVGIVFGDVGGIAPGYKAALAWRSFEFYSEAEYVMDADDADDSFLYTWTEVTVEPAEDWRAGLVVQRTKAYETGFDIQRGLLAGLHRGSFDFTAYVLNPDESPAFVLAVGAAF
jgi:hypothetical protein